MDFPRQHRRPLRRTPRLPHSSAKVHIRLSVKHYTFLLLKDSHGGVSVVKEHGEVGAALDGRDLSRARAFSRCAVWEAI